MRGWFELRRKAAETSADADLDRVVRYFRTGHYVARFETSTSDGEL